MREDMGGRDKTDGDEPAYLAPNVLSLVLLESPLRSKQWTGRYQHMRSLLLVEIFSSQVGFFFSTQHYTGIDEWVQAEGGSHHLGKDFVGGWRRPSGFAPTSDSVRSMI
jgi:hypothetical protein